ncbi:hypothetical protein [Rhodobacter calidifons]|nr:hypothetical protein [Rhodobacter calidifons]
MASSVFNASRSTVHETPKRSIIPASPGRPDPTGMPPDAMARHGPEHQAL